MRAIVKHPGQAPTEQDIGRDFTDVEKIIGDYFERCITGPGVHVYCDEDGLSKNLPPNLIRPSDGSPVVGTVVVIGLDGRDGWRDLSDREVALWLATLALAGVDDTKTWRAESMADLAPRVHDGDRKMFDELARRVGQ